MLVFFDVDTQRDFLYKDGALYIEGSESILNNLEDLNFYAIRKEIPIIKTMDLHFADAEHSEIEQELEINGGIFPNHCMYNTEGARAVEETMSYEEVALFTKQVFNVFSDKGGNPYIDSYLDDNDVDIAVVYGVATDFCVKASVLGLIDRDIHVMLVEDAIYGVDEYNSKRAINDMKRAGAELFLTNDIIN